MSRLKGAIIGYGFISSQGHLPAYLKRDDVEIVAVADVCEARRHLVPQIIPNARIYTDYESLLTSESLDFVDIATPPYAHAEIARMALCQGFHVLCEKPLTATTQEARMLLEQAQRSERVIFPCHNYKHAPVVKAIQSVVSQGSIGKVRSLTLSTFRNTHAKGVSEWRPHWRRDSAVAGGGIAMDHGSHTFYLTFDWLQDYPVSVTAKMQNTDKEFDTEDNLSAVLTFPKGHACVHLTWTAGVRKVIYTVQGDQGAVTVDDDRLEIARMEKKESDENAPGTVSWNIERKDISSHWMDASHVQWFNSLFDRFLHAIQENQYAGKEAEEAYRCVELIEACYQSAAQGCREISLKGWDRAPVLPSLSR